MFIGIKNKLFSVWELYILTYQALKISILIPKVVNLET